MSSTRYRRGQAYAADMAVYSRAMAEDNSQQMARLKRNLVRALQEDVTPRQREFHGDRRKAGIPVDILLFASIQKSDGNVAQRVFRGRARIGRKDKARAIKGGQMCK